MQTTMIKVNELCPEIDAVIEDDSVSGTIRVKRIYDYINDYMQNVTIIYPTHLHLLLVYIYLSLTDSNHS